MNTDWEKLTTHVVDGTFPLQRCIGSTDHSGVFLTQSAEYAAADLALKLIPLDTKSAQTQLARWRAATRLSHPHLLRIFKVGVCQLAGTHYLYVLMEYADQTLTQVLEGRALDENEVREMLVPALSALEYLHAAHMAQGSLKPSNILVVGDQLKLSSDTLRFIGESAAGATAEDDVRALGATLCEALTCIRPSDRGGTGHVELPAAVPASFHAVIVRCLSQDPQDRPTMASLSGWLRGEPLPEPNDTIGPAARARPDVVATSGRASRRVLPWAIGALAVVALLWIAYRWVPMAGEEAPAPPRAEMPVPATPAVLPPVEPAPSPPTVPPAASAGITTDEAMPAVSQSALATVSGNLRVTVRVSVNKAGTVIAATADDPGPSRYFERRSLEAARKWTFAPADTDQRAMQIRFEFTRSGVTASASPLP
ncbi:MAG: TonB family protein [Pseudomonadota bacterium]